MDWRCGSSGRAPALLVLSLAFNSLHPAKKKRSLVDMNSAIQGCGVCVRCTRPCSVRVPVGEYTGLSPSGPLWARFLLGSLDYRMWFLHCVFLQNPKRWRSVHKHPCMRVSLCDFPLALAAWFSEALTAWGNLSRAMLTGTDEASRSRDVHWLTALFIFLSFWHLQSVRLYCE
jgi:hypothetical protein